jgi:hypothetical protein
MPRLATLLVMLVAMNARGATVELPLEGYYRVGKYMPVSISTMGSVDVRGPGLVPVRMPSAVADCVIPVLMIDRTLGEISVGSETKPVDLRLLGDNERLVGTIGNAGVAGRFLREKTIAIPLDATNPLRGPAIAWETLDAVVIDGPMPSTIDPKTLETLLAAGVTFAVRTDRAPGAKWPWAREGEWWVLRLDPPGPRSAIAPAAYGPVSGWAPGSSTRVRAQAVAIGAMVAIAALAVTLVRTRYTMVGIAGVAVLGVLFVAAWVARQPALREVSGEVVLTGGSLQTDRWVYQKAVRATEAEYLCDRSTRPMLISGDQAREIGLVLECNADGSPRKFSATLARDRTIAYLLREVISSWSGMAIAKRSESPLQTLARDFYVRPGIRIIGETFETRPLQWSGVVLERTNP